MENRRHDSRVDTMEHIRKVQGNLKKCIVNLMNRAEIHDKSKLEEPELSFFDEYTPKLADVTYGSDEYKSYLEKLKPALQHHYEKNLHHPEHYEEISSPEINQLKDDITGFLIVESDLNPNIKKRISDRLNKDRDILSSRINNMDLLDVMEMLMDWEASSTRNLKGDIFESIEKNQQRFGYDDLLKNIFINTINRMNNE